MTAAVVALLVVTLARLTLAALTDLLTALVALVALAALLQRKVETVWLILGGALVGLLAQAIR